MLEGFVIKDGVLEAYTLKESIVKIPEEVRIIGAGAFKACHSIEEVILPETIISIMDTAFKGCKYLKKINFPSKLTHIGEYAFHRCHSLHRVELPLSVKSLGNCAFLYCDSLEYVSISGVTELGLSVFLNDVNIEEMEISKDLNLACICDVFTGCSKISKISLSDGTTYNIESLIETISSRSNAHPIVKAIVFDVLRMMDISDGVMNRFLTNLKHVEVLNGITAIGKSCFFDRKGIISLKLPKTLTDIGSRAFRNCINLERVEFANDNVTINPDAFKNCTTLKYVTLSDGTTYELKGLPGIANESMPEIVRKIHSQILNNFFISGTTLMKYKGIEERVVVPAGITIIGEKAFVGNETVGRVVLPDSVREIREEAFADCVSMQTIKIPEGLKYIGKSAFENCLKLIRVELPESLEKIEKSNFNRCKKLNEVLFGSKLKEIGDLAFYACNSLKDVHLPEKIISIGDMAFYKCFSLKEITLPKSLSKLGNNVFTAAGIKHATINCDLKECGTDIFSQCNKLSKLDFDEEVKCIGDKFAFKCPSLKYVNLPSSIEYVGRNAFEDSIYIKEAILNGVVGNIFIDGSELTGDIVILDGIIAIAGGAFYGNTKITSVKFPESLMRVGSRAFCSCTSLESISLNKGVTALEEGVFAYCTSIESVTTEGKITYISDNSFFGCSSLEQVPSSEAVHIGNNAFSGCKKLDNINISCTDIHADAFKGTAFLENLRNRSPLVVVYDSIIDGRCCTGEVIIPEGVVSIAPYAFAGNDSITRVMLPKSLITIGDDAFGGCKNLKEISLPPLIKNIGRKAFEKCVSLTDVIGNAEDLGEGAFSYCINLKIVTLIGVSNFGKEAFCGCTALESCKCKELQHIGDGCFSGCDSLKSFDFSNIKSVGIDGFNGCNSLKKIMLNVDTYVADHAFEDCGCLEEVIISNERPDNLMSQQWLSMQTDHIVSMMDFSLMQSALQFGSYAFSGCTALKVLVIGEKRYSTYGYSVLLDKHIPDFVKTIYNSSISCFNIDENLSLFGYNNKDRFVHIPEGIKRIEREVFKDAMNLEEVHIPESVEYIGERAFHGTRWLEKQRTVTPMVVVNNMLLDASLCHGEVVIPDFIKIVSGWAFANCFELTKVTFSSSKTVIEEYAFRNCINLKKVITFDGKEYSLTGIEDRNNESLPLRVKQIFMDCLNCFKTDENNVLVESTGNIGNLILADGITGIYDEVFKDSNLLTYITLSKDTTAIGKSAFEQCKWLVSVKNAYSVKRIEKLAFSGCILLESIELSDKLEYIGMRAFEHCTSLKRIVIPEGITEIPERAFYRCKSLEKVSLPSTLKTIGREAFALCYELKEINVPKDLENVEPRAFAWCSKLDEKHILDYVASSETKYTEHTKDILSKADFGGSGEGL